MILLNQWGLCMPWGVVVLLFYPTTYEGKLLWNMKKRKDASRMKDVCSDLFFSLQRIDNKFKKRDHWNALLGGGSLLFICKGGILILICGGQHPLHSFFFLLLLDMNNFHHVVCRKTREHEKKKKKEGEELKSFHHESPIVSWHFLFLGLKPI